MADPNKYREILGGAEEIGPRRYPHDPTFEPGEATIDDVRGSLVEMFLSGLGMIPGGAVMGSRQVAPGARGFKRGLRDGARNVESVGSQIPGGAWQSLQTILASKAAAAKRYVAPEMVPAKVAPEQPVVTGPVMKPIPPAKLEMAGVPTEPGYLYHATSAENLAQIAASGKLRTNRPSFGTDQRAWPDGGTERRAYFSPKGESVGAFAPAEGQPVIVRTKQGPGFQRESGTGDMFSRKSLPTNTLEYFGTDGNWHPVGK